VGAPSFSRFLREGGAFRFRDQIIHNLVIPRSAAPRNLLFCRAHVAPQGRVVLFRLYPGLSFWAKLARASGATVILVAAKPDPRFPAAATLPALEIHAAK
jgi:hypothetical protein